MNDIASMLREKLAARDYQAARRLFEDRAAELDRDIACRNLHAETLFRLGQMPAALDFLHETERAFPADIRAPLDLGQMYSRANDDRAALHWFERARTMSPRNMWPYYRIAQVHRRRDDPRSEVEVLRIGTEQCRGRVRAEEYQTLLKELASARSLLAVVDRPGYERHLAPAAGSADGLQHCVHVTMVKDEGDVIHSCLAASYGLGFRKFVVANNGSTDCTGDEIRRFAAGHPDAVTFVVDDPVVGYYQDVKTMALVDYAHRVFAGIGSPVSWAFPIDADEELQGFTPDASLSRMIGMADAQAATMIVFAWCHAASPAALPRFGNDRNPHDVFSLRSRFGRGIVRKCAFRIDGAAMVEMGAHFVRDCADRDADMIVAAEHGFAMTHYAVRSVEQSKRKTINGYNALQAATGMETMGGHWRSDYEKFTRLGDVFFEQKVTAYIDRVRAHAF